METARRFQYVLLSLLFLSPRLGVSAMDVDRPGPPVNGIALLLTRAPECGRSKAPCFRLEFRNVSENDLLLKLGIMLANGRKQYPSAVVLNITDAHGTHRRFDLIGPSGVAGRIDPFVLALPVDGRFSIAIDLSKYFAAASKEYDYKFTPGSCWIEAEFLGKSVSDQEANLDSKNVALFPYWEGIADSNELHFEISIH
jgi:hypothetical protein